MNRLVKQGFLGAPGEARPGENPEGRGWRRAVILVERWLATAERVDALLEQLTPDLAGRERARAQQLFYGVVRWHGPIEAALAGLMARPPRTKVRAVLAVAGFELLEQAARGEEGRAEGVAKVVHHAVEQAKGLCSVKEAGLVNAVARKLALRLVAAAGTAEDLSAAGLARRWSHPAWLVERWLRQFGPEAARALLEWNQQVAPVLVRWRAAGPVPDSLGATRWPGFFEVRPGAWEDVRARAQAGELYVQDPATRLAAELLDPRPGETLLDACAAPGGKSLLLADLLAGSWTQAGPADAGAAGAGGRLVALDLPGEGDDPRFRRLQDNLGRAPRSVEVALMPADLRRVGPRFLREYNLPETYDGVLVDVPCTNTGVMRHRVDVKWRLQEGDFAQHARQQLTLLRAAARLVRDGGRLVYSTCSVDAEENDLVVQQFLREVPGWRLERSVEARPWVDGHDGAGVFRLQRA